MRRIWQWVNRALEWVAVLALVAIALTGDALPPGIADKQISRIVGLDQFDFIGWEVDAFAEKSAQAGVPIEAYLDDEQRAQYVLDYLDAARRVRQLDEEIGHLYADPSVADPQTASADRRAERDRLRAEAERRRPTAEAILQDQITAVLADEGFAAGGRVFPPVLSRITPLPHVLIVSPRDEIRREPGATLSADMTVDRAEEIEGMVAGRLDKSALVTPIGGLAVYPSMIVETSDLLYLLQVTAHEWTHHWLFFHPLGIALLLSAVSGSEALTINETVASLAADELGIQVLKRFYPAIARRDYAWVYDAPQPPDATARPPTEPDPPAFNFNREMHATRVTVDEYLAHAHDLNSQAAAAEAEGRGDQARALRAEAMDWVVKAERYMEDRRQMFVANGYPIRKLNQAYFAFYGSYADRPGASGADPIGPAVRALRAKTPSLLGFLTAVAPVTTLADLQRVLGETP